MRSILFLCILTTLLCGRENPFIPEETTGTAYVAEPAAGVADVPEKTPDRSVAADALEDTETTAGTGDTETINFLHVRFLVTKNRIRIETKDRLKKDFAIRKPARVILDFSSNADFPTRKKRLEQAPFREIRIGVHKGFYRVVIELDKTRPYRIEPFKYGYIFTAE